MYQKQWPQLEKKTKNITWIDNGNGRRPGLASNITYNSNIENKVTICDT
jgi:hypothetical protein